MTEINARPIDFGLSNAQINEMQAKADDGATWEVLENMRPQSEQKPAIELGHEESEPLMQTLLDLGPLVGLTAHSALSGITYLSNPTLNFLVNIPITLLSTSALGVASSKLADRLNLRSISVKDRIYQAAMWTFFVSLYGATSLKDQIATCATDPSCYSRGVYGALFRGASNGLSSAFGDIGVKAFALGASFILCGSAMLLNQFAHESADEKRVE